MYIPKRSLLAFLALLTCLLAPRTLAGEFQTFTDVQGRTIEARLLEITTDAIRIQRKDRSEFAIPLNHLAEADRARIATLPVGPFKAGTPTVTELNKAIGQPLFKDGYLWDDTEDAVSKRLGLKRESRTATQSSFRRYPGKDNRLLGARPYSVALYGQQNHSDSLSIVYANKGDFFAAHRARYEFAEPDMDALDDAIEHDADQITARLNPLLGEPERQSYGKGSAHRRVSRWDWGTHAFLLSAIEDEYVALQILPTDTADARGHVDRTRDDVMRERTKANVTRKENNDVFISNIPMVDQGPKGYCVPATFERCLRYFGIPADMYLLAMSGETQAGGGTSMEEFIDGIKRDVSRYGREVDELNIDMEIRDIARYIDQGLPLLWSLNSTPEFNALADDHTMARRKTSASEWPTTLASLKERADISGGTPDYGHIAMVVGYNAKTGEVAVSDSWGPAYERRWILAEAAENVTKGFYVIKF